MSAEVVVVGGRGKTGRAVIEALRARGASARPVGRAELRAPEPFLGAVTLYLMAPNMHPDEPAFVGELLAAARAAGVRRVVYHSVAAPYLPEMPHHLGKAEAERLVRASGVEWVILQPCAYVQNLLAQLGGPEPELVVPYDPDRRFGLVDLADVGEVAAAALLGEVPAGSSLELGGPALVSVRDVARRAGELLGREVTLRRISSAAWAQGPGAALDARERAWMVAMFDYYDAHGLPCGPLAVQAVLDRAPTPLELVVAREVGP